MIIELVSSLSLASHSDPGPSWWQVHRSAKMDSSEEGSGRLAGQMDWRLSPSYLSRILRVGGRLLVSSSLPVR